MRNEPLFYLIKTNPKYLLYFYRASLMGSSLDTLDSDLSENHPLPYCKVRKSTTSLVLLANIHCWSIDLILEGVCAGSIIKYRIEKANSKWNSSDFWCATILLESSLSTRSETEKLKPSLLTCSTCLTSKCIHQRTRFEFAELNAWESPSCLLTKYINRAIQ